MKISKYANHLCIGMKVQILDQNRVMGTILVKDVFPDGRETYLTLKIVDARPTATQYNDEEVLEILQAAFVDLSEFTPEQQSEVK